MKSARNAKRRAQQIVDVVVAQDIGKLPDKNVPEALARVPGVQIDRTRGEGGEVRIRGLSGVMTTVNGSPSFSAGDRTTYLQDISSDLVAGIEVYKTRTPDQVEGSQTGVINLTLRRPTDFKEGMTVALSARGDYSDQVKKLNPYYSALVAYNKDTSIGKIGASVNATYNKVRYNEAIRYNALPVLSNSNNQIITPSTTPVNFYLPYQVGFSGTDGWSERGAVQVSTQWRPDDHWTVTAEGGYAKQRMLWSDSQFDIPITYSASATPPPVLSNLVMADDGRLVKSVSVSGLDPFGPGRQSYQHQTINYNGRFQVEYKDERIEFNGWANYNRSNNDSNSLFHWIRFSQQPQLDITFNDPAVEKGGMSAKLKNVDLTDPKNYLYIDGFSQRSEFTHSAETEFKGDLRVNTFVNLIDWIKVGFRATNRTYTRAIGDRGHDNLRLPMSGLPDYKLSEIVRGFDGPDGSNVSWLIGDSRSIRSSWDLIRSQISGVYDDMGPYYPKNDPLRGFGGGESTYAGYGMFHYDFDLLIPIEGTVGARLVNSLTKLRAVQRTESFEDIDGELTYVTKDMDVRPKGNYVDLLPSVNAIFHFTPKLQLRTSWTYDVGRPSVYQINPALSLNLTNVAQPYASGGNPKLGPVTLNKYDASLEWYFGSTGSVSLAVWQWNQNGLVDYQRLPEILPESPTVPTLVERPYNLGKGRHRGIEGSATTFFTFLPGVLKSFGGSVNGTLNITRQAFPSFDDNGKATYTFGPYLYVSKYVYNLVGFFERDGLNLRVAYNWRSRQQLRRDAFNPYNNIFLDPVERLDASINYEINKNLTVAFEASNLTKNGNLSYFGTYDTPQDVRYFSRNFSFSVRTRF